MGLVSLMDKALKGETSNVYEFTMAGKADELVGKIANGDLDIALLPANVASVLYTKTQGSRSWILTPWASSMWWLQMMPLLPWPT